MIQGISYSSFNNFTVYPLLMIATEAGSSAVFKIKNSVGAFADFSQSQAGAKLNVTNCNGFSAAGNNNSKQEFYT